MSNFYNTRQNSTNSLKMIRDKKSLTNIKQRLSKLKKSYFQDLVKQIVGVASNEKLPKLFSDILLNILN